MKCITIFFFWGFDFVCYKMFGAALIFLLLCLLFKIDFLVVVIAWQLLKEAVGVCDVIYNHSRLFYIVQLAFLSATLCFQFWILNIVMTRGVQTKQGPDPPVKTI